MQKLTIPGDINTDFLKQQAGITAPWGAGPSATPGSQEIYFGEGKLQDVLDALGEYELEYMTTLKNKRLEEVAEKRRTKEKAGPSGLVLDDKTVMRLTAAAVGLMIDTARVSVNWEISRGVFQTIPRANVLGLAVAAVNHVQACFDAVKTHTEAIMAAETIAAVEAVDITVGWP